MGTEPVTRTEQTRRSKRQGTSLFGLRDTEDRFERIEIALAEMGGVVESQLADAITAFARRDVRLAYEVARRDALTDAHERLVADEVSAVLEGRRLTAAQVRRALSSLKIAAEMERAGDLAKNVAKRTRVIAEIDPQGRTRAAAAPVERMGQAALGQLSAGLDALFRRDPVAAHAVRDADDQVDDLYNAVFAEVLAAMADDAALSAVGTHLLFAAKNLERIGDHATNIAERVHYAVTGEEIEEDRPKTDATSAARRAVGYPAE